MELNWEIENFDDLSGCWLTADLPDGGRLSVENQGAYNSYSISLSVGFEDDERVYLETQGSIEEVKAEAEEIYQAYVIQTYGVDSWLL